MVEDISSGRTSGINSTNAKCDPNPGDIDSTPNISIETVMDDPMPNAKTKAKKETLAHSSPIVFKARAFFF
jgi:hypothetical protein